MHCIICIYYFGHVARHYSTLEYIFLGLIYLPLVPNQETSVEICGKLEYIGKYYKVSYASDTMEG